MPSACEVGGHSSVGKQGGGESRDRTISPLIPGADNVEVRVGRDYSSASDPFIIGAAGWMNYLIIGMLPHII